MAKYHITRSGNVAACRAVKRPCPLGGEHYESADAAYEGLDNEMNDCFSIRVATEEEIIQAGIVRDYLMQHRAPTKDDDDFHQPLHTLTKIYPSNVYEKPEWYGLIHSETHGQILAARGEPNAVMTIYRGVPKGVREIHPGDWVALSKEYAEAESLQAGNSDEEGEVIAIEVPASVIYTNADSLEEWGFSGNMILKGRIVK